MAFSEIWDEVTEKARFKLWPDPLTRPVQGDDAVAIPLPGYLQTDSFSCGFVAGMMAVHAFFPARSPARFYRSVAPDRTYGTTNEGLVRALRRAGLAVGVRTDLTFDAVAAAVRSGAPVVTTIATGCPDTWHWVTLYGVGRRPRRVFMAGAGRPVLSLLAREHELPWAEFAWLWRPRGFGLVCRPRRG